MRYRDRLAVLMAVAATAVGVSAGAQSATPAGIGQRSFPVPGGGLTTAGSSYQVSPVPPATPISADGTVVEDAIARVNDRVITRTEYERSQQGLVAEAKQDNWSPAEFEDKEHNLLRDMIDQQLLLSKGKELGITGDSETIRQLDEIRKRANLPDMEALQKAAEQQGVSFEDFKQNIRNQAITQQVVRDDVGRRISMTPNEEQAYFAAHKAEFEQPEQVHLSEILIPTPDNATDAQITAAQTKAEAVEAKLKAGADFAATAKGDSGGPTASAGGDLGDFKRGTLGDVLEKATFGLPTGQYTEPIRTRQGFVILRVDGHQAAGTPPLQQVEPQVQEGLYMSKLQPALRSYLTQARQDAFVEIKPGFTDSGSNRADTRMKFTTYAPPPVKKRVIKKQAAEQERADKAEKQLSDARAKLAAKQEAKAAASGGTGRLRNASAAGKAKKIRREKVRYGQAPRNALPAGSLSVAAVPSLGASTPEEQNKALGGEAPGAAMGSPTQSVTSISTGTGMEEGGSDALAPKAGPQRKTRFGNREVDSEEKRAQVKLASAEVKATKRPIAATSEESADEKLQAAPLGLADKNVKKEKKHKRAKNEPKERLGDKVSTPQAPQEIAPTVNPTLGTSATGTGVPAPRAADRSTLPPATPTPPNPAAAGKPIPSVTSASPNAPTTTAQPPQ